MLITLLLVAAVATAAAWAARAVLRWRGTRLVQCPETRRPAAVDLDVREALVSGLFGRHHIERL